MGGTMRCLVETGVLSAPAAILRRLLIPPPLMTALLMTLVLTAGCQQEKPAEPPRLEDPAPEAVPPARARMVIDTSTLDMGDGDIGKTSTSNVRVRNAGTAPLSFDAKSLDRSCNCSDVVFPGPIAPGGEGFVIVKWTPVQGQSGVAAIAIKFRTNDPDMPEVRLELLGRVTPFVQFVPEDRPFVQFGKIKANGGAEREIRLVSMRLTEFDLEAIPPLHGIKVEVSKLTVDRAVDDFRCGYVLKVITREDLPAGQFKDRILLKVSAPGTQDIPPIELPVYAEVDNGVFKVTVLGNTPATEVVFRRKSLTDGDNRVVQLRFFGSVKDDTLVLERCNPLFLKCNEPKRLEPGLWEFDVRVPKGNEEAASFRAKDSSEGLIVLRSSQTKEPIAIRVRWMSEEE